MSYTSFVNASSQSSIVGFSWHRRLAFVRVFIHLSVTLTR
jgi:hypothetical protein